MKRSLLVVLCAIVASGVWIGPAQAQQIPEEAREELERRNLTVEEARRRAQQLGIDLSDPRQAVQRARELGIPESQIRAILQAVQSDTTDAARRELSRVDTTAVPPFPVLGGTPTIEPDSISVTQLPREIEVRVPLMSSTLIRRVNPFFLTAGGDTTGVQDVERTKGSVLRGTWGGTITIPRDTMAGTWTLFVEAATQDTTLTLSTGRLLRIFAEGEIPIDSLRQKKRKKKLTVRDTLEYFGYDTFNTIPEAFLPSATGPVDDGYVVGPNDELRLTVWGGAEFQYDLVVDREGRVTVPNVGQFTVAGKRLDELRTEMKTWLSQSYAGLTADPPTVFMDLTITRIRPVQVFVLGEVPQPGGYTVSSFATVFNALYSVGGPTRQGSLRNLRVVRSGTVVDTVDIYDYLLKGFSPDPVRLQSNDYVFVPPRGKTVAITGEVKRPAFYEMKEGETVADLLDYAGGLEPEAYTKRFSIERVVPFEDRDDPSVAREVRDFDLLAARSGESDVSLADGDHVKILSIKEATDPAVTSRVRAVEVTGAVYQPGRYEISDSLRTVRDLIERADSLTGDAYSAYAELVRVEDDLQQSMRSLDLDAVMADAPTENIVLQPGDSLHVRSLDAMREDRTVTISGQVRDPGEVEYREDMTIRDLLMQGGGLADDEYQKEVFMDRADLYRVSEDGSEERVIPFHLGDAIAGEGMASRPLEPGDEVQVYPATVERLEERFVNVAGAVKEPGEYTFRDNLTLKDVILQAEGFAEGASLREVEVTRMVRSAGADRRRARTIRVPLAGEDRDTSVSFSVRDTSQVLQRAAQFQLRHRDRVFVRTDPQFEPQETVTVRGEVRFPGEYTLLRDNERLSSVLERAGGVLSTGYLKGGRLLRPRERDAERDQTLSSDEEDRPQQTLGLGRTRTKEQVIVEMAQALDGDLDDDVILQPGDEIVIPTQPNTVAIRGNVANEGLVKHAPGRRVDYYLERAGGIRENTEGVFLTQASGATFRINTGWFRRTPMVDDGATIRVQEEPEKEAEDGVNISQTITEVTGVLSSALTIVVLATRAFN